MDSRYRKNKKSKMILLLILSAVLLNGCYPKFSFMGKSAVDFPLENQLTEQEVIDYYKKALEFDSIAGRNTEIHEVSYETREVTGRRVDELKSLVSKIEVELNKMYYDNTVANNKIISEETFNYIKSLLNDKRLVNGDVKEVVGALGHYFVDVEYEVKDRPIGNIKTTSTLLGLNGAFRRNYADEDFVDSGYIISGIAKLNKYYEENNINKILSYDSSTESIIIQGDSIADFIDFTESNMEGDSYGLSIIGTRDKEDDKHQDGDYINDDEDDYINDIDDDIDDSNEIEDAEETGETGDSNTEEDESRIETESEPIESEVTNTNGQILGISERLPKVNTREFNNIAGSSMANSAYMPQLDIVMERPQSVQGISGMGIYPSGGLGLRKFGFNRSQINGKMVLRYVFKEDTLNDNEIIGFNIYPVIFEMVSGIGVDTKVTSIPDFLMEELDKLIERSDRALINNDLSALMSGEIYSDVGMAILNGYTNQYVNVLKNVSTVRRVIFRDNKNSTYLLEVETIRQEGPRGANTYGTYRDKSYVVVEQYKDKFIITDTICMTRIMNKEPVIKPDSVVLKRLMALNLAGEIPEESKEEIKALLNDLYLASTHRVLNGPHEVTVGGQKVEIEKGMYNCFNSDPELLSQSKREYINSKLRGLLVKHGVNVNAEYKGVVTEWIGGVENQAEFVTEELIVYKGKNSGYYMETYYLVSNMGGKWVIDDMKILIEEDKTGEELNSIMERIKGN